MSTHFRVNKTCYLCFEESEHFVLGSSNTFGSPDLDLRPAPMMRNTMRFWIQECPRCGYVSTSIDEKTSITLDYLKTDEFNSYRDRNFKSPLAVKFFKSYLISKQDNNIKDMFYNLLHTAWVCDDYRDFANALFCRELALEIIDELIKEEGKEELKLVKCDLLRRSKQFDRLINEYSSVNFSNDILNKVLAFQINKAKEKDSKCYLVSDANKDN